MEMQTTSTPVNAKGQGHLVTLAKGYFGQIFSKSFFLEITGQIEIFNLNLCGMVGTHYIRIV